MVANRSSGGKTRPSRAGKSGSRRPARSAPPARRRLRAPGALNPSNRQQTKLPIARSPIGLSIRQTVSAILLADGPGPLAAITDQLARLPVGEILVVLEGAGNDSLQPLLHHPAGPILLSYPEPLGPGVARSIAARAAEGELLLFVGGASVIPAEELVPLLVQTAAGADMALNDIGPRIGPFAEWEPEVNAQACLNRLLGRAELAANSLAVLPHAISRRVPEAAGYPALAIPPLAQALALRAGLRACAPASIRLPAMSPVVRREKQQVALGDHIEAISTLMWQSGARLNYPDTLRKRHIGEAVP